MPNYDISEYILLQNILYTIISTKNINGYLYNFYIDIVYNYLPLFTTVLNLLDKHFPKSSILHKIFNSSSVTGQHPLVYQILFTKQVTNSEEVFICEKRHSIDKSLFREVSSSIP